MTHNRRIHVDHAVAVLNQPVVESLMVSLNVVMICVFLHNDSKMPLSQRDDLGQTFGFDRADQSRMFLFG
jgi:hypothetical protein